MTPTLAIIAILMIMVLMGMAFYASWLYMKNVTLHLAWMPSVADIVASQIEQQPRQHTRRRIAVKIDETNPILGKAWEEFKRVNAERIKAIEQSSPAPTAVDDWRTKLAAILYPGGIKHPQQAEWESILEKVRDVVSQQPNIDALIAEIESEKTESDLSMHPQKSEIYDAAIARCIQIIRKHFAQEQKP